MATGMKANAVDACPAGKQCPPPPSRTPQAQCDTYVAVPPNSVRSHGQLVRLMPLMATTSNSDSQTAPAIHARSRRLNCLKARRGHQMVAVSHASTAQPTWRAPSCHHLCKDGSYWSGKPSAVPNQRASGRSSPLASHSSSNGNAAPTVTKLRQRWQKDDKLNICKKCHLTL